MAEKHARKFYSTFCRHHILQEGIIPVYFDIYWFVLACSKLFWVCTRLHWENG